LGLWTISACGKRIYSNRPCFKLHINRDPLTKFLRRILKWPLQVLAQSSFQPWLLRLWPTLSLPDKLVLKQRGYQPEDGDGYEREKKAYFKLRRLQGSFIAHYYGEVFCGDIPAIIMSEEAGKELLEFSMTKMETEQVLTAIKAAYEAFAEAGVIHGDPELHNFLWDGKRLIVIDFNGAEFYTGEKGKMYSDGDYREVERRLVRTSL
jgi:hypothetical protein